MNVKTIATQFVMTAAMIAVMSRIPQVRSIVFNTGA